MSILDFSIVDSDQWSTVADLIEEIQDRIPEEKIENIFPVLNRAIRTISKRLFVLKSDLIIASLSVPIYASDTYTADTIAFVTGTPPTITDSVSKFISVGLLTAGRYITTDSTTNPGPFRIVTAAAGTLTMSRLDSITTAAAGDDVVITSSDDYAPLPDDFWGLAERPYISAKTWQLRPSPGIETEIQYTSAGEPHYFKIKGTDIWLYPGTGSDITIMGDYFKKPSQVSRMNDAVPFAQLLDDVFQEYLIMALAGGSAMSSDVLKTYLEEQVDLVVNNRSQRAATPMPEGIHWGSL